MNPNPKNPHITIGRSISMILSSSDSKDDGSDYEDFQLFIVEDSSDYFQYSSDSSYMEYDDMLSALPQQVHMKIFKDLSFKDFLNLSLVCKSWVNFCQEPKYWEVIWQTSRLTNSFVDKEEEESEKSYNIRKYINHLELEKIAEVRRENLLRKEKAQRKFRKAQQRDMDFRSCYHFCVLKRPADWLTFLCLALQTIFAILKLDGVLGWEWRSILIPMYIASAQFILSISIYDILRFYFDNRRNGTFDFDLSRWTRYSAYHKIFGNHSARELTYSGMVILVSFNVLLTWKLEDPYVFPWIIVFAPIFITCAIMTGVVITGGTNFSNICDSWNKKKRYLMLSIIAFVFIQTMLLWLKVDGILPIHLLFILIPLYLSYLLFTAGLGIFLCCKGYCEFLAFVLVISLSLILGCVAVWTTLLALQVEGDIAISYTILSIPAFISLLLVCFGCVGWDIRNVKRYW
eukprot:TRINITY_DN3738_c0_g1_i1.p1 TRINITY_DN3738_c0_g1~~TRINITY_DN3738_c0_g1_i1.p1  ORF type:complete len:471 (-),score=52.88 TRINITY_DN3738_c0_g1_i1:1342-2718(-)